MLEMEEGQKKYSHQKHAICIIDEKQITFGHSFLCAMGIALFLLLFFGGGCFLRKAWWKNLIKEQLF